jgi:prolipoprotein diacylglyceryltransferase
VVAQAIGRLGNWFNSELFGRPTTLPWGLRIDPDNPDAVPGALAYHPTFLYELLWCLAAAAVLLWADRRYRLGAGGCSPSTWRCTRSAGSGSSGCASTMRTPSSACG